jgi:preprotein translocase subunit SecE
VKTNPIEFFQQVRQEAAKVTWPSRNETMVTTIMVLIMVVLASFFFLGVDAVLKVLVEDWILTLK